MDIQITKTPECMLYTLIENKVEKKKQGTFSQIFVICSQLSNLEFIFFFAFKEFSLCHIILFTSHKSQFQMFLKIPYFCSYKKRAVTYLKF